MKVQKGFQQSLHPHFYWAKVWSLFRKRRDNENSMSANLALNQQTQVIKRGCFPFQKDSVIAEQHCLTGVTCCWTHNLLRLRALHVLWPIKTLHKQDTIRSP